MRVLIFSTAYLPMIGGAEIAVKEITDRLRAVDFVLLTPRRRLEFPAHERIGNVDVYRVGSGGRFDKILFAFRGARIAGSLGRFDVVWAVMASYGGFAALRYKKRHPDTRFLLTLQEGDSKAHIYRRAWIVWPWFKQIFTKANRIQAISSYLAAWAKDMGARCPIDVVPNGVGDKFRVQSLPVRQAGSESRVEARQTLSRTYNIPIQAKVIISVSRLVEKNGLFSLVEAMEHLPPSVHALIVGSGYLKNRLESLARSHAVHERVHFAGDIPNTALPAYLAASDVFCRPSVSEGLGIAFLEAMAAGVPVVAPNVGGISEFLKDGETGLFCTHDPKDIAGKIEKILNTPALAEALRANARDVVAARHSWDDIAVRMGAIFHHL